MNGSSSREPRVETVKSAHGRSATVDSTLDPGSPRRGGHRPAADTGASPAGVRRRASSGHSTVAMSDGQHPRTSAPQGLMRQAQKLVGLWRVIDLTLTIGALSAFGAMGLALMGIVARLQSGTTIFGSRAALSGKSRQTSPSIVRRPKPLGSVPVPWDCPSWPPPSTRSRPATAAVGP